MTTPQGNDTVLVGVVKTPADLELVLRDGWYRIPLAWAPKRVFHYVAFYQPASFGTLGKRIEFYGHVIKTTVHKRRELLPHQPRHPHADQKYLKIELTDVRRLPHPIRNIIPRRISFGFTDLHRLLNAHEVLALYGVPATEQIVASALGQRGIPTKPEVWVTCGRRRVRVDLVITCQSGSIAIECDNRASHHSLIQRARDRRKDTFLRRRGWRVIRLHERDILEHLDRSLDRILAVCDGLGGAIDDIP